MHDLTATYVRTTGRIISQSTVPRQSSALPATRQPQRLITVHFRVDDQPSKMTLQSKTRQVGDRVELWVDTQSHRAHLSRPTVHWTRWVFGLLAIGVIAFLIGVLTTGIRTTLRIAKFDPATQRPALWTRVRPYAFRDVSDMSHQPAAVVEMESMIPRSDGRRGGDGRRVLLRAYREEMPSEHPGETVGLFHVASPFRRPAVMVVHDPACAAWFPAMMTPSDAESTA